MAKRKHPLTTGTEVHRPFRWTPATAAARVAIDIGATNADDVGCLAWQTDNDTFWVAIDTGTGATKWRQFLAARDVEIVDDDFDAEAFKTYTFDTLAAAKTATLPASPLEGDWIEISAAPNSNDYPVTIDGNDNPINGVGTFALSTPYASVLLVYNGSEWRVW